MLQVADPVMLARSTLAACLAEGADPYVSIRFALEALDRVKPPKARKLKIEALPSVAPFTAWSGEMVTTGEILAADRMLAPFTLATCLGSCARRDLIDASRALTANPGDQKAARLVKETLKTWRARKATAPGSAWTYRAMTAIDARPHTDPRVSRVSCYLTRRMYRAGRMEA